MSIQTGNLKELTPMMQQYNNIKSKYKDCILFFRVGDFYEMFDSDAIESSKLLGIALTSRNNVPMCGIPYHSYKTYLAKLLQCGKKIAICEQLEDPSAKKGIVDRDVVDIITPGMVLDTEVLDAFAYNILMILIKERDFFYAAAADVSTGDLFLVRAGDIYDIINNMSPKEIIADKEINLENSVFNKIPVSYTNNHINIKKAIREVTAYFNIASLKSLHIDEVGFVKALYITIKHLEEHLFQLKLKCPKILTDKQLVYIDASVERNLELIRGEHSLFNFLNKCKVPMGSRLLKNWILYPERNLSEIYRRQEIISYFLNNIDIANRLVQLLKGIYDVDRIITRVSAKKCTPRDLIWLKDSIKSIPEIKELLLNSGYEVIIDLVQNIPVLESLFSLIDVSIDDDPAINAGSGGIIKSGYSEQVDILRNIKSNSKKLLIELEKQEKEATGIGSLKIKYNKVFGYIVEVSKSNIGKVPAYYVRRQTLSNAERYTFEKLKELENAILEAENKQFTLEYDIFMEVRSKVLAYVADLRKTSLIMAELDVLSTLAFIAAEFKYTRPTISENGELEILEGRHPLVEAYNRAPFVPNDIVMNSDNGFFIIITGPNMSGKSTYIRMVAIIILMAHIGSFVPAASAKISLVDRIFTRIGASDDISKGESTFMVEMVETSNILKNATKESLIILDEIGRGTSTFDGISIAWAIAEHILNNIKAKTLFATHYHELTDIAYRCPGVKNFKVDVKEWKDKIVFLRKITPGSMEKSYGIYVARLAGLPDSVIDRSYKILEDLEKNEFATDGLPKLGRHKESPAKSSQGFPTESKILLGTTKVSEKKVFQPLLIFEDNPVVDELKNINPDNLTPIDALNLLYKLREKINED
jgi:DNA mismatch repair protein MutS